METLSAVEELGRIKIEHKLKEERYIEVNLPVFPFRLGGNEMLK
jgi:hypothetical protein